MTINTLADRYAAAKKVLDDQEAIVKGLKAEIVALGVEEVEGARNFVKIGLGERNTLDTKAVEAELGAAWVKAHSKSSIYEILRIKAKPVKKLVGEALAELENVAGF
jgi:hypothetical protein